MNANNGMRARAERGFVLVGVVMFVLALTILGMSLYGLSAYEGQFLTDTRSEEQALFQAEGGIALVQQLLSVSPHSLTQAQQAVGYEGVVQATAWQDYGGVPDSTSNMDWSKTVFIRVRTQVLSQSRIVEAAFTPSLRHSPYKRLFTGTSSIAYLAADADGNSRVGSTTLNGRVWQTVNASVDTLWASYVDWDSGRPVLTETAPTPDVAAFMTANLGSAVVAVYADSGAGDNKIRFDAAGAPLRFWTSPPKTEASNLAFPAQFYGFYCTAEMELSVSGIAVWLAPGGIRFDSRVKIKKIGSLPATLVIVTTPNGAHTEGASDYRDVGLWFFDRGVEVEDDVKVILVSSGHVRMEIAAQSGSGLDFDMPDLNVFADRITLMGPRPTAGNTMELSYPASMDAVINDLISRGALPAASGSATGGFTLQAGTWRLP